MQLPKMIDNVVDIIFQSMHPIKDATTGFNLDFNDKFISIHAPYKGCNKQQTKKTSPV